MDGDNQAQTPRTKLLKNGAIYDLDKGRIIGSQGRNTTAITSANAAELSRKRKEKAQRLLRQAIVTETADKLELTGDMPTAPAAVAAAGGILWREIVLGSPDSVYPRDRLDAWEKIGRQAGVLGDTKQADAQPQIIRHEYSIDADTLAMLQAIRQAAGRAGEEDELNKVDGDG